MTMADEGVQEPSEDAASRGASKVVVQMNRLKEANNKYKTLLKLAKDRISAQQEEMDALKGKLKLCDTVQCVWMVFMNKK
jgi:sulfur transfer protein SufE